MRKLEQKVCDLACEVKLLREHIDARSAEFKCEIAQAIVQVNDRGDARIARVEQTLRWVIGLIITLLLGMVGGMAAILARLA